MPSACPICPSSWRAQLTIKLQCFCWRCVAAALARGAEHQRPLIIWHRPLPAHPTSGINYTCLALTRSGELDSREVWCTFYYYSPSAAHSGSSTESFFPLGFIWHWCPCAHHRYKRWIKNIGWSLLPSMLFLKLVRVHHMLMAVKRSWVFSRTQFKPYKRVNKYMSVFLRNSVNYIFIIYFLFTYFW